MKEKISQALQLLGGVVYMLASIALPGGAMLWWSSNQEWTKESTITAAIVVGIANFVCTIALLFLYGWGSDRVGETPGQRFARVAPVLVAPALGIPTLVVMALARLLRPQ
jgi:hypothetical protein